MAGPAAGRDPAIPIRRRRAHLSEIAGTRPGDDEERKDIYDEKDIYERLRSLI
jgi:hypothetical protein